MKHEFQFFPEGGWEWIPPWHDNGASFKELLDHVSLQTLTDVETRKYWIFTSGAIMNALYYDLMIAKQIGDMELEG